jgi:hypothetical protein
MLSNCRQHVYTYLSMLESIVLVAGAKDARARLRKPVICSRHSVTAFLCKAESTKCHKFNDASENNKPIGNHVLDERT